MAATRGKVRMSLPASAKVTTSIVTRDREKAKAFYGGRLGFAPVHDDAFAAVYDLDGTMLRISTAADHVAQAHTVLGWEVVDIARTVEALREAGRTIRNYDGFGQDALATWAAPGSTSNVAWFEDPDGNLLSIAQL